LIIRTLKRYLGTYWWIYCWVAFSIWIAIFTDVGDNIFATAPAQAETAETVLAVPDMRRCDNPDIQVVIKSPGWYGIGTNIPRYFEEGSSVHTGQMSDVHIFDEEGEKILNVETLGKCDDIVYLTNYNYKKTPQEIVTEPIDTGVFEMGDLLN